MAALEPLVYFTMGALGGSVLLNRGIEFVYTQIAARRGMPGVAEPRPTPRPQLRDGRRWLLVGAPGSGKSTAARSLIRGFLGAGARVVVCDPDGAAWPRGAVMVGAPDDYAAIGRMLAELATLAGERRSQFQHGQRQFDPVLVVIDEAPAVLRETPDALAIVADLVRRGRKLAISVVLLSQDTQTKTLGLEGQSKLLEAFERFACRIEGKQVLLLDGDTVRGVAPLDHDMADMELPIPVSNSPEAPTLGASDTSMDTGIKADIPDTDAVSSGIAAAISEADLIAALVARGASANAIYGAVGGNRNEVLEKVRKLRTPRG